MEDKKLRVHGVPDPKGTTWLKEVRLDAARNTVEQLRQQKEKQEFEAAKARGITTEEIVAKGREDLDMPEPSNFAEAKDDSEVEDLRKQLEAERKARKEAESKVKKETK